MESNNGNNIRFEYENKPVTKTRKKKPGGGRLLIAVMAAFLCLVIGLSAGVAGVGYFLSVNGVDVRSVFDGTYEAPGSGSMVVDGETGSGDSEIIKRIEVLDSSGSPVAAIAEKVIPSIVSIRITYPYVNYFYNMEREGSGEGSGIILTQDGYILTNNHVVEAALDGHSNLKLESSSVKVYIHDETEKPYEAEVIGRDPITDLALLKINANGLVPIEIGDSDMLDVGELAVAIGNPGGMMYMGSVTSGIISGLNREVYDAKNGSAPEEELNLIQTDAAINPGNSGGALVDSSGKLIGINTLKIVSTGYEGLGFAIPVNRAMEVVDELMVKGYVSRGKPNIGISINSQYDAEEAEKIGAPEGLLVIAVGRLTPAESAGIQVDDIITEFNGVRVKTFEDLNTEKNKYEPGDEVTITVFRKTGEGDEVIEEYLVLDLVLGEANY